MASVSKLSLGGSIQNTTGAWNGTFATDNAMFLKIFGGEVFSSFERYTVTDGKHRVRNISSGKTAQFPFTGRNTAQYFKPGTNILEDNAQAQNKGAADVTPGALGLVQVAEKTINIDDLLISTCFIDDLDLAKSHYDYRGPFSKEIGRALAFAYDKAVFEAALTSALGNTSAADPFQSSQKLKTSNGTMSANTSKQIIDSIYEAAQGFDERYVPEDERYVFVRPREYNKLLKDSEATTAGSLGSSLVHRDYTGGGNGNLAENFVVKCAGMTVVKTPHLPILDRSLDAGAANVKAWDGQNNDYHGNWTDTIALCWHPEAVGTVKLKDVTMESEYLIARQGTLMVGKMAVGHGGLRPECVAMIEAVA